jgi:hypothetical protein
VRASGLRSQKVSQSPSSAAGAGRGGGAATDGAAVAGFGVGGLTAPCAAPFAPGRTAFIGAGWVEAVFATAPGAVDAERGDAVDAADAADAAGVAGLAAGARAAA